MASQPISSWEEIIQTYIPNQYEEFKKRCLDDDLNNQARLKEIYNNQLDENISQHIYLHAEMNILTKIVDQKYKSRTFIAVSKKCCYLCELYIKYINTRGYNIHISGTHKKLYHRWQLPDTFKKEFVSNTIFDLV